jgi:hypothetical protein
MVTSYWLFLYNLYYDAGIHENAICVRYRKTVLSVRDEINFSIVYKNVSLRRVEISFLKHAGYCTVDYSV